jgi:hypothetical protein
MKRTMLILMAVALLLPAALAGGESARGTHTAFVENGSATW